MRNLGFCPNAWVNVRPQEGLVIRPHEGLVKLAKGVYTHA